MEGRKDEMIFFVLNQDFIKIFKMSKIRKYLGNPVNLTKILVQDNF